MLQVGCIGVAGCIRWLHNSVHSNFSREQFEFIRVLPSSDHVVLVLLALLRPTPICLLD